MTVLAWRSPEDALDSQSSPAMIGDIVRTGENYHPHYRVIAVAADRAWIRDIQRGSDHVIPLNRCRRIDDRKAHERPGATDE